VQTMSLNRADLRWLANTYIETPTLPSGLGYEIAKVVEVVGPGVTAYRMGDRVHSNSAFSISDDAHFRDTVIQPQRGFMRTPVGRIWRVEDIAGAVTFLASPLADFIDGSNLRVDGGYVTAIH
jgi:NAD(P)-dependent dehydrogenase (short-subunit alcohol dehydrogenase family)